MPRPLFTRFEDAVITAVEHRAEATRSDAQAIVDPKLAIVNACYDAGMSAEDTAARILGEVEPLTGAEMMEADALVAANVVGEASLDRLIDKWTAHHYRPTLFVDEPSRLRLADLYDRRAAERGILVTVFRAGVRRAVRG